MRRTRSDVRKPWVEDARPVRIARSALAPNVPSADLFVTRGHALLIDGVLIPAEHLINGTTISLDAAEQHNELEFYHLKLASHDVIYAEGTPCESLLRVDETMSSLYLCKQEETQDEHCAPILGNGLRSQLMTEVKGLLSPWQGERQLDLVRARLAARAGALAASSDARTAAVIDVIGKQIRAMPPHRIFAPGTEVLGRAALLSGILCRLQGYEKDGKLRALQDCVLFLQAQRLGLVVLTANVGDYDILLQLIPSGRALFYRSKINTVDV